MLRKKGRAPGRFFPLKLKVWPATRQLRPKNQEFFCDGCTDWHGFEPLLLSAQILRMGRWARVHLRAGAREARVVGAVASTAHRMQNSRAVGATAPTVKRAKADAAQARPTSHVP